MVIYTLLKLIYFFNWRKIALQCDGFCHTGTQISHNYTCITSSWASLSSLYAIFCKLIWLQTTWGCGILGETLGKLLQFCFCFSVRMLLSESYSKAKHSLKHKTIWSPPNFSVYLVDLGVGSSNLESLCLSVFLSFFPEEEGASHAGYNILIRTES